MNNCPICGGAIFARNEMISYSGPICGGHITVMPSHIDNIPQQPFLQVSEYGEPVFMKELRELVERLEKAVKLVPTLKGKTNE